MSAKLYLLWEMAALSQTLFLFPSAPQEAKIGCFKARGGSLTEQLADYRDEIVPGDTAAVIRKCAQLAHDRGYEYFALGKKGICFSGPLDTSGNYFAEKGVHVDNCSGDIGGDKYIFIFTLGKSCSLVHFLLPRLSSSNSVGPVIEHIG